MRWHFLAVLAMGLGCARARVVVVDGFKVYESHWEQTKEELRRMASFDLRCQPSQLDFRLLDKDTRFATRVGVTGCGAQASYTRLVLPNYAVTPWRADVIRN